MKLKRTLQILLLFCVAFLWMPVTAQAASTQRKFIEEITKAERGATVTLEKDLTISQGYTVSGSTVTANPGIIIDGQNHTLKLCNLDFSLTDATLQNIKIILDPISYGKIKTFNNCTFSNVTIETQLNGVALENHGVLSLTEANISGPEWPIDNAVGATIYFNSGNLTSSGGAVMENNGVFNMKGGTIFAAKSIDGIKNTSTGTVNISGGEIKNVNQGIYNEGTLNMKGGSISDAKTGIENSGCAKANIGENSTIENCTTGINNMGALNMKGGTISGSPCGVKNTGKFDMSGGEITGNDTGVDNEYQFTMEKGEIKGNKPNDVVNDGSHAIFTWTKGMTSVDKIVNENGGKDNGVEPAPSDPEQENAETESTDSAIITDSEGNIVKEPERWVPTTPDEIKRYAFLGKEAVNYTCPKTNSYGIKILNAMQGPKCFVSFEAVLGDYTMGRTYNIYADNRLVYTMDGKAVITLSVPEDLQKEGRTFKMICVTEGGLPILLNDLDKNPETVTFETDKFYAFALIYK